MKTTHRKNLEATKKQKNKLPILTFESGPKLKERIPRSRKRKADNVMMI